MAQDAPGLPEGDNDSDNLKLDATANTATPKVQKQDDALGSQAKSQNEPKKEAAMREADTLSTKSEEQTAEPEEDINAILAAREEQEQQRRKEWLAWLKKEPQVVGTAEYDWENFMNRSEDSNNHGRHIIELLRMGPDDLGEVKHPIKKPESVEAPKGVRKGVSNSNYSSSWIQRIRVQSPAILACLRHAGLNCIYPDDDDDNLPHIFYRPFRGLAHVQPRLKLILVELERKLETETQSQSASPKTPLDTFSEADDEPLPEWLPDTAEAFEHLKHFVKLVDEQVVPLYSLFNDTSMTKIRFNDLALLFKPGDLVYQPPRAPMVDSPYRRHQNIWRIAGVERTSYSAGLNDDIFLCETDHFSVWCYCLDYDGVNYGATFCQISIACFTGEQEVTKLAIYPVHFLNGSAKLMTDLRTRGGEFCSFIQERHLYHDGWSIPDDPGTDSTVMQIQSHPEYIQSAVVVDYEECFKQNPQWKATFTPNGDTTTGRPGWLVVGSRIMHWTYVDGIRQDLQLEVSEVGLLNDIISPMYEERLTKTHSISATIEGNFLEVPDEDLVLLPGVLVVYSLRDRKFAFVNIDSLQRPQKRADIFEDLKIDPKHERVIKSLVRGHFETRKAEAESERPQISLSQDLVYGKGSGLFILLHGPPGVGKTATAEAIAQYHDKPLFSITCGDLGLTPGDVEAELKGIFRLAHLWDCVLLLDEADVFLARRDIASLQRNALVSVFLRVLEYYTGILFLTTNRVGLIDEAFKSRIHLSLLYPKLNRLRTLEIFRVNIKRLRAIEEEKSRRASNPGTPSDFQRLVIRDEEILYWADSHYRDSANYARWNGRQIRNAFQIAASMVRYDTGAAQKVEAEPGKDNDDTSAPRKELVLGREQFEMVSIMTGLFEDYFQSATGEDDEMAAQLDGYRADGWKQHKSRPAPQARNSPNPRGGAARPPPGDNRYSQDSYPRQRPPPPGRQAPQKQRPTRPRAGQEGSYQHRSEEQDDFYSNEEPAPRRAPRPAAAAPSSRQQDYPSPKESFDSAGGRNYQQGGRRRQDYHEDDYDEDEYDDMEEAPYEAEGYAY